MIRTHAAVNTLNRHLLIICAATCCALGFAAAAQSPFNVDARLEQAGTNTPPQLTVTFTMPEGHYLYEHMTTVKVTSPENATLKLVQGTKPKRKYDEMLAEEVGTYSGTAQFRYEVKGLDGKPLHVDVDYQGCNETTCFIPQTETFVLTPGTVAAEDNSAPDADQPQPDDEQWQMLAEKFTVAGRATGYLHSPDFLSFLQQAREGTGSEKNLLQRVVDRYGLVVAMLLVIPLGLLLNLTPCVLPMIPINLAIIGAGAQAGSQKRGFLLGAVYGSGMALVYGVLGLVVVTTGARFGALNSSPWFNLVIAAVFIALGLAMFDVFVIDFSRFQGGTPGDDDSSSKAPFVTAFLVGGMAALLAGACVAPVLIWVLVLAIDLYAGGSPVVGLMLPFLLGIGMALPWPFAGAGLSFLPKPGGWMNHVKHAFGILIFIAAIYYGHQAVVLFRDSGEADVVQTAETASGQEDEWLSSLTDGLRRGLAENKPVFLDFWALSCKSCMKMKRTTFKDPDVVNALDSYVKVAFQADDTEAPRVKNVLQYYDVLGLPTYIVLEPAADANTETNRSKR